MAWRTNPGTGEMPECCRIRNAAGRVIGIQPAVHVRLFNGIDTAARGDAPWPPYTSNWEISARPHPFQIKEYEVAQ